jgi:hypothetical protein
MKEPVQRMPRSSATAWRYSFAVWSKKWMEVVIEAAYFPKKAEPALWEKSSSMNRLNWAGTSRK